VSHWQQVRRPDVQCHEAYATHLLAFQRVVIIAVGLFASNTCLRHTVELDRVSGKFGDLLVWFREEERGVLPCCHADGQMVVSLLVRLRI
jgi:hypothetical protein